MALQDTKKSKLVSLGYSGAVPQMERAFYIQEAGASSSLGFHNAERAFLTSKGYSTGANRDCWKAYLISLGYSGSFMDMLNRFWTDYTSGPADPGFVVTGYVGAGYFTPE